MDKTSCWDKDKNPLPSNKIAKQSGKHAHLNCEVCRNPFSSIISNIYKGCWCPICKNKTELKFSQWFKEIYTFIIDYQKRYEWCKNIRCLPFDFVIEELKLIIEIDGRQHFMIVTGWSAAQNPDERFKIDKIKMDKAIEQGYTIIRIFQEDIWFNRNDWITKLKPCIKKYDKPQIICIGNVYNENVYYRDALKI